MNEVRVLSEDKGKFGSVQGASSNIVSLKADNSPSNFSSSSSSLKLNEAKAKRAELGFTPVTEKHCVCVLKLIEN